MTISQGTVDRHGRRLRKTLLPKMLLSMFAIRPGRSPRYSGDRFDAARREGHDHLRPARPVGPGAMDEHHRRIVRCHPVAPDIAALRGPPSANAPIQWGAARPISSGESSCTKWTPLTVFSVNAGHPRTTLTSRSLVRIAPGSAFRNSLGTLLVPSQS